MPLCSARRSKPRCMQAEHAERQHVDLHEARARRCRPCPTRSPAGPPSPPARSAPGRRAGRGSARSRPDAATRWRGAPISWRARSSVRRRRRSSRLRFSSCGVLRLRRPPPTSPRPATESACDQVLGQAERLADVAQRALGAVADHGRAERGAVAAVGVEHPLHDDLAPLVLEVDVDVGRLAPLLGDEALEQQVVAARGRSR